MLLWRWILKRVGSPQSGRTPNVTVHSDQHSSALDDNITTSIRSEPSTTHINKQDTASFPFVRLPAEIRITIYKFAMQDTLAAIPPPDDVKITSLRARYNGAVAFLHASKSIREESAREMLPVVRARCDKLEAFTNSLLNTKAPTGRRRGANARRYKARARAEKAEQMTKNVRAALCWVISLEDDSAMSDLWCRSEKVVWWDEAW